jgi:pimeloyl-ACP methyl ester carboxylesterase
MAHGLLVDNLASWYFGAAPRVARDRRVVLYDLRGHGRSEAVPTGYDVATGATDLAALVDATSEGPVHLIGHSYGALVALRCALDHPHLVRSLGLVEAPLPPSRLEEMRSIATSDPKKLLAALPEGLRGALLSGRRRAARARKSLEFLLRESSLVADLAAEEDVADEQLARLDFPVQLIYGERSSCRPVGDRLLAAFPQARLEVLDGGHYLSVERSAEVGEILAGFLHG